MTATSSQLVLRDRRNTLEIRLDRDTGLPVGLTIAGKTVPLAISAWLETEGIETEGHPFGLAYADTVDLDNFRLTTTDVSHEIAGYEEVFTVRTAVGDWDVDWEYRLRDRTPRLEIQFVLTPGRGNDIGTLRNLYVDVTFTPDSTDGWQVEAPGAALRAGLSIAEITERTHVTEPAFSGSGIVVLHNDADALSLLIWPFSRTELLRSQIQTADGQFTCSIATGLAARIAPGERLRYGAIELDVFDASWEALRPRIKSWYPTIGISSPADTPNWVPNASIFEVQIGKSVFWHGWEYSPYPTMRDLYNDLGRIAGLGFDCIQIMPRQPFPSYNVYDYNHISISYGDEADLIEVVRAAHAHGMKVILDILMHGVIDADVIQRAADRVRSGPFFDRLKEGVDVVADEDFLAYQGYEYLVSWARHILDFEGHWSEGSPGSHPLVDEHPDWFMRDSSGEIIGVYTKAFDVANLEWQRFFTESALNLVKRLDIDGFRFDAPTYNEFPNWSPETEKRASASQLGSVRHFEQLRYEMRQLQSDAVMYTEPSGVLFRQSMDITYNYDEHWLFHAVLRPEFALKKNPLGIRHARDLAIWFRDKEAVLPAGAITARHIDSHDSFWWPLPGFKWRREQYGLPATRAILAVWSLIGGVYMTFVGGETGIEDDIRKVHRLRRTIPELGSGTTDFDAVRTEDDGIFAVARIAEDGQSLVLVNLTNQEIETNIGFDTAHAYLPKSRKHSLYDAWSDELLRHERGYTWEIADLKGISLRFAPYQPRVVSIRAL